MKTETLRIYLLEIRTQSILAHQAIEDMSHLAAGAYMGADSPRFWYCLQMFFSAAANISKLLWPTKRGDSERGRELRTFLEIDDQSPLHEHGLARELRNHIEHLDERLDKWIQEADGSEALEPYVRGIGAGAPSIYGLDASRCFLYFDASRYSIIFEGNEYPIMPTSWAIHALMENVDARLNTPQMASSNLPGNVADSAASWPLPSRSPMS